MELQEIFDTVITALRKQGCKSSENIANPNAACLYRQDMTASCTIKCAAGHLLLDEDYDPSMEGKSSFEIFDSQSLKLNFANNYEALRLIDELQKIHDYYDV